MSVLVIKPVTYMKTRAARLLRTVGSTRRPVVITQNGEPRGVLLDYRTYEEMRQATLLLKLLAQGEADARGGRIRGQKKVFAEARRRLRHR